MIRELIAQPQEIAWLPWAVQYFFFIGVAACCALVAIACRWVYRGQRLKTELIALAIGASTGIVGPIALSADVHQPGRIWHFYAHVTPWSWMSIGAFFVPLFVVFLLLYFALLLRHMSLGKALPKWLAWLQWGSFKAERYLGVVSLALLFSTLLVLLYTGKEVNVIKAQPLWHSPWLPWVLFLTALQTVPMLIKTWFVWAKQDVDTRWLSWLQVGALLALMGCVLAWLLGDNPAGAAFRSLPEQGSVWWTIGLSLLAYWVVLLAYGVAQLRGRWVAKPWLSSVMALAALSLCWTVRWGILMQSQTLPKYNVFINPYHLPWGFDGLLGIMSTFGLWLTLLIVIWALVQDWLPVLNRSAQHG
ncbi:MAG: tetrathionate reductase subunit TtrC [Neisseriaceae bacterium]|nr:tetrathionate reductase subunit TtrC [Neisseriaceae bacterium]MBP6862504.1 tetrathionate reductase subunit TtrC [Neisseriaceae bacterium]